MDATLLVMALALVGQSSAGDRYQNYTSPGAANLSPPTYGAAATTPTYAPPPPAGLPSYAPAAVPPDPLFTAAAEKRNTTTTAAASGVPTGMAPSTVAPISTPVPTTNMPRAGEPATLPRAAPSPATASTAAPSSVDTSRAGELVRDAVVVPPALSIEGKGRTLFETLSPLGDRRRQLDAVVAYWRLATETAELHFDWQQTQFLEHLQKTLSTRGNDPTTAAEIGSRTAAAQARLRESELRLYDAQFAVGQQAWQAADGARPLTVDLPHTGVYKTQFERVFAAGGAPPRAVLLNRTLPLRQQVVTGRADAVWAAQSAYEQAFEAFQRGQIPAEEVLAAIDDFRRRRSEFITAVRRYNEEIAEYALTAAPAGIGAATLVDMLIKNGAKPAAATVSDGTEAAPFLDADIAPVAFLEPAASGRPTPAPPLNAPVPDPISAPTATPSAIPSASSPVVPSYLQSSAATAPASPLPASFAPTSDTAPLAPGAVPPPITPAMERPLAESAGSLPVANARGANPLRGEPTLAPPPPSSSAALGSPSIVPPSNPLPSAAANPYAVPAGGSSPAVEPAAPGLLPPFVPQQSQPAPLPQSRYRPHTTSYRANFQAADPSSAGRPLATQELVESLYDFSAAPPDGTPISLGACLAKVSSPARSEVLAAYWHAAELRARVGVWSRTAGVLNETTPRSPALQASTLAAAAERDEATIALQVAQLRLTELVGAAIDQPWLLPETLPHGGRYDVKSEALARRIAGDARLRRDVERIPTLHETLVWRAEAVTAARTAAQGVLSRYAAQRATPGLAAAAVERQAREACSLLETTTRYNLAIADYALGVLPATTPRDMLVGALVVDRNTVASRP